MCNELKKTKHKTYYLNRVDAVHSYTLQATTDTPFFHHIATLSELKKPPKPANYTHIILMLYEPYLKKRQISLEMATFHIAWIIVMQHFMPEL